jgi:hypothetical protein
MQVEMDCEICEFDGLDECVCVEFCDGTICPESITDK